MPLHEQKNNIKEISGTKIKENRYKQTKGLDSINFEGSFKKVRHLSEHCYLYQYKLEMIVKHI